MKIITFIKTYVVKLYRIIFRKKIDYDQWVFSSSFNRKFNYNSKYMFEYIQEYENDIRPIFVINDEKLRRDLENRYGKEYFTDTNTFSGINKVLGSGVWCTSAGLPTYGFNLSKKRTIVNLWHGVPLKKIGMLSQNQSTFLKYYFNLIFSQNYTYILTTSSKLINTMADSFNVPKEKIKVWGQPRNDLLFNKNSNNGVLKSIYGNLPEYKKIILYAPTFREQDSTILFPFRDMDFRDFEQFLENEKLIVVLRTHQSEAANVKSILGKRIINGGTEKIEDIMTILNVFDLLITDYSSIYIDYLLLNRPIIFLPYDLKIYEKNRGFNFEYEGITPGPKPKKYCDFKHELLKSLTDNSYYIKERKVTNDFFNEIKKPCTRNIVNNIINQQQFNKTKEKEW